MITNKNNLVVAAALCGLATSFTPDLAMGDDPGDLADVRVPLPVDIDDFLKDRDAAIRLGKAFFWDVQLSSQNDVACATCHHKAGTDSRVNFESVNPGFNGKIDTRAPLSVSDFPFRSDDILGSIGVSPQDFVRVVGPGLEGCEGPFGNRQTTGRHSPPSVNAIFHDQMFWDGRAKTVFNGQTIEGDDAKWAPEIWIWDKFLHDIVPTTVALQPAATASQAVGPVLSSVEMSCAGRTWNDVARKLLPAKPLQLQQTAPDDSVLGVIANANRSLLPSTYRQMIDAAFRSEYVSDLPAGRTGLTQAEANFALYYGIAVMMYEAQLVSDNSKWDRFVRGEERLTSQERLGLEIYEGDGRCDQCHQGAEFTNASNQNGGNGSAFANIGVRPNKEDKGKGRGEFKSPSLRNVALTNPYFHTGGYLTLKQVVNFYNRGGDFRTRNIDSQVRDLELSNAEEKALVAFMLTLTDDDVRCDANVFDHPSLPLPGGTDLPAVGVGGLSECWVPALSEGLTDFHMRD